MEKKLLEWAERRGHRIAWADPAIVEKIHLKFQKLKAEGLISRVIYDEHLSSFKYPEVMKMENPGSIILVAVRRAAHLVTFQYDNQSYELALPPTYHNYNGIFEETRSDLWEYLGKQARLEVLKAPLKTIAAHIGFTKYGRNNLAYIDGFGSFFQLVGLVTDRKLNVSNKSLCEEPAAMDECENCQICMKSCPVGAIRKEQFQLKADQCLTFFSEMNGPLPEEFSAQRRPCLIGCLTCQEVCPKNKRLLHLEKLDVVFTTEETRAVIGESETMERWCAIKDKINAMKATEFFVRGDEISQILKRNLRAVLNRLSSV